MRGLINTCVASWNAVNSSRRWGAVAGAVVATVSLSATSAAAPPSRQPSPAARPKCPEGMVFVPGGSFSMGSPEGQGERDERPRRKVTLSGYCMDRLEVTAGQYQSCQAAGACTPPDTPEPDVRWTWFCTGGQKDKETHPINCLDWNQATAFCAWRGARLPTEAEWEYASRGSDGRTYPWGNAAPSAKVVNACGPECRTLAKAQVNERWGVAYDEDDGHGATAPVGSFPAGASPAGVLDMAGNVREWVADFYGPYPAGPQRDPTGPPTGEHRVVRGGSWNMTMATFLRSAYRSRDHQDLRLWFIGFRCAANPG